MTAQPRTRILVIEDDVDIADMIDGALYELGYTVSVAASGEQGWTLLRDMPTPPALVLLDFLLSGEDGSSLSRKLKDHPDYRQIPIVMMSAHPGVHARLAASGADGFLAKPFDLEQLDNALARHLPVVR